MITDQEREWLESANRKTSDITEERGQDVRKIWNIAGRAGIIRPGIEDAPMMLFKQAVQEDCQMPLKNFLLAVEAMDMDYEVVIFELCTVVLGRTYVDEYKESTERDKPVREINMEGLASMKVFINAYDDDIDGETLSSFYDAAKENGMPYAQLSLFGRHLSTQSADGWKTNVLGDIDSAMALVVGDVVG